MSTPRRAGARGSSAVAELKVSRFLVEVVAWDVRDKDLLRNASALLPQPAKVGSHGPKLGYRPYVIAEIAALTHADAMRQALDPFDHLKIWRTTCTAINEPNYGG